MRKAWVFLLAVACLGGCATETHILVGDPRQKVLSDVVDLYYGPPERNYEVIAIVTAPAHLSADERRQELKRQAAKLGANGVLMSSFSSGTGFAGETSGVEAKAIYVETFDEIIY